MPKMVDMTGRRFGQLIVIGQAEERKCGFVRWLCQCDCGKTKIIMGHSLRSGQSKSCGHNTFRENKHRRIHGATAGRRPTPEYRTWQDMLKRCRNPKNKRFHCYGARGIKVCERWYRFDNFLADMGPRPYGYSIERIDNDGNYEPSNCKWIPRRKNVRSKQRKGDIQDVFAD